MLTTPQPSTSKLEISLDSDLMRKLKTKADTTNKTPSEVVAELLREKLKQ
jgi:metal-responsive CopG/Arc/MetJ family transcriptional regulator